VLVLLLCDSERPFTLEKFEESEETSKERNDPLWDPHNKDQ
jgi:hypothetical protein